MRYKEILEKAHSYTKLEGGKAEWEEGGMGGRGKQTFNTKNPHIRQHYFQGRMIGEM